MVPNLQPYPEYKDSGHRWLGKLPAHWAAMPNRALFAHINERNHPGDQMLSVTITQGVIPQKALLANTTKKDSSNKDKTAYKLVCPDDIAYNKMRAWQGAIGVSSLRGIISPAYIVMRPRGRHNPRYFHFLFRTPYFAKEAERWSYGITSDQWSLRAEHFKMIYSALPPPDEQAAIVRFLAHSDQRINILIRAKRQLVVLLNEQRQAIIHRAVTRGLNHSGRTKPSGVSWVDEIAGGWDALRSKYLFREVDARSATGQETRLSMSQKLGLIPSSRIEVRRLFSESGVGMKVCEKGDLVLNRLKAHLGVFALAPERGLVSPDYTVFRPIRPMQPRYFELVYGTPACRVELRKRAKGIVQGFWRLYTDDFYDIRVPVPSLREQEEIVAHLDTELHTTNTAIDRAYREIELIREYRTRLVADVVTGQLDVRAAARHLPAEPFAPEPEPADSPEPEETEA
jgi:type I restriction enzyme S subunit